MVSWKRKQAKEQLNIKEKTGILAEYTKVRYDSNFFRVVEMYPTLY